MINCLLWDIDGTLLNFKKSENVAIKRCLEREGLPCTDSEAELYSVINDRRWKALERKEITREQVCLGRFEELFERLSVTGVDIREFQQAYQNELSAVFFFNSGCPEILTRLSSMGIKQYAVTNGNTFVQERKLRMSGLGKLFDGVFISEKMSSAKPSTEFFNAVFDSLPGIRREECMIVGDSLSSDILGGNNAGIFAVWYNPDGEKNNGIARPDAEIRSLDEVEGLLRR